MAVFYSDIVKAPPLQTARAVYATLATSNDPMAIIASKHKLAS